MFEVAEFTNPTMMLKVKVKHYLRQVFILSKFFVLFIASAIAYGSPIIYNQRYNNPNSYLPNRGYLTPPRAITTLNTFVPRRLIPSAPPRSSVPRVYESQQSRVYTAPPVFRPIPSAPTTRRPLNFVSNTNNNTPRYAFNYGVNDNRVNTSNYRLLRGLNQPHIEIPPFYAKSLS